MYVDMVESECKKKGEGRCDERFRVEREKRRNIIILYVFSVPENHIMALSRIF